MAGMSNSPAILVTQLINKWNYTLCFFGTVYTSWVRRRTWASRLSAVSMSAFGQSAGRSPGADKGSKDIKALSRPLSCPPARPRSTN